jgi:hypothetical protein
VYTDFTALQQQLAKEKRMKTASRLTNVMDYHPSIGLSIIEGRSRLLGTTTHKCFFIFEDDSVIVRDGLGFWYSEILEFALDEIAENWI